MRSFEETRPSAPATANGDDLQRRYVLAIRDSLVTLALALVGMTAVALVLVVLPWVVSI